MKKRFLYVFLLILVLFIVGCNFGLNEEDKNEQSEQYKIYELAKESGYIGTYEDWLNSIKGENGKSVEIQVINNVLCWKYVGDSTWIALYDLTDSKGEPGEQGIPGENGKSAYEIFLENYPEYQGTEKEWITDVASGNLCALFGHDYVLDSFESINDENNLVTYKCTRCDDSYESVEAKAAPNEIIVSGDSETYVGYSIKLTATVSPITANQSVVWTSNDETIATVDQNGKVTVLKDGTVRIKATSKIANSIYCYFKISISNDPKEEPPSNMGGYNIVLMGAESLLTELDPFLDGYNQSDKSYKQLAWREVEEKFNCKIKVVAYPDYAPWGNARIAYIIDKATTNTSECDLCVVESNWINQFGKANAAIDVLEYYNTYGKNQMEPAQKQAGTYKNKLYVAGTGISQTNTSVDLGLFYNMAWLEELGLEDPATMFNEGRWTYSNFETWVMNAQYHLGYSNYQKVLGGHPYYFYYGMTNAAGVKIADAESCTTNVTSQASKDASALISKLAKAGCVNTTATWNESREECNFLTGDVLMGTGYLWYLNIGGRWSQSMWGEDTRYGYVPFPYPDDVAKEDTRIGVSGLSLYLYVNGRKYPTGVTSKDVYRAMNEMFLNTIKYQETDDNFDPYLFKYNSLSKLIDNPASIEAIMYYDSTKVFYDPAHSIYDSVSSTVLKAPSIYVMYDGKDFDESFDAVKDQFDNYFKELYS